MIVTITYDTPKGRLQQSISLEQVAYTKFNLIEFIQKELIEREEYLVTLEEKGEN